jgi:hypothetical protein
MLGNFEKVCLCEFSDITESKNGEGEDEKDGKCIKAKDK